MGGVLAGSSERRACQGCGRLLRKRDWGRVVCCKGAGWGRKARESEER